MTDQEMIVAFKKVRLRRIWHGMKSRCYNEDNDKFPYYGGRGISICSEWKESFERFSEWALENGYSEELSLDRVDNNGNYEPSNCKWATDLEQMRNTRRNVYLTVEGITKTVMEWSEITGISYPTIIHRINCGWTHEDAVTKEPLNKNRNKLSKGNNFFELMNRVKRWQDSTFPKATPSSKLEHLSEEIEELMYELMYETQDKEKIQEEFADCFLLLYGSAFKQGMTIPQINFYISQKMDKNEKRKWQEPDVDGVVRHIKE